MISLKENFISFGENHSNIPFEGNILYILFNFWTKNNINFILILRIEVQSE